MPVQSLKLDLDGVDPVIGPLRFTPRALFLYTTLVTGDGTEYGTNTDGELGTFTSLSFAHEGGDGGFASSRFVNPAVFVFGLGNIGCRRVSNSGGEVIDEGITVSSWDPCGFTLSGTFDNVRVGGLAFGSDDMEYAIGNVTLTDDGADATVSGLGFQPKLVMLIRQLDQGDAGEQSDIPPGLGVSNGTQHWFDGYYVPVTQDGGATFSHDAWTNFHTDGCAILVSFGGSTDVLVYDCTMGSDGFTLSSVSGSLPADAITTDYLYLAIDDPAGDFNIGSLATNGGVEEVSGIFRPDALLVTHSNREVGEEHSEEIPAPPGFTDDAGLVSLWTMGACDRYTPDFAVTGDPGERLGLVLRADEATGDGVYALMSSGAGALFTVVGGVIGTLIDAAAVTLAEDDVVALICNGDSHSVTVNASTVLSGTASDVDGPGRAAIVADTVKEASCGTIGTPPLLDGFNRANAVDVDTDWLPFTTFILPGVTSNASVALNQMVTLDSTQGSYWSTDSFTDAELSVVVGETVFFDSEHDVWSLFACAWSGLTHLPVRRMGGDPVDTDIARDIDILVPGTYPNGPYLELDADRVSSWGVTTTGWRGSVTADTGNHQVGWLLCRLGPSTTGAPCGFQVMQRSKAQIYRRL